jgi:hypothetical protein
MRKRKAGLLVVVAVPRVHGREGEGRFLTPRGLLAITIPRESGKVKLSVLVIFPRGLSVEDMHGREWKATMHWGKGKFAVPRRFSVIVPVPNSQHWGKRRFLLIMGLMELETGLLVKLVSLVKFVEARFLVKVRLLVKLVKVVLFLILVPLILLSPIFVRVFLIPAALVVSLVPILLVVLFAPLFWAISAITLGNEGMVRTASNQVCIAVLKELNGAVIDIVIIVIIVIIISGRLTVHVFSTKEWAVLVVSIVSSN